MKPSYISLKNYVNNTCLSFDHINTGTGKDDSTYEHDKSEMKALKNKKEDLAAILLRQFEGT